ncbi:nucleotidyltransferase family protein [uncultured Brevundimonas sp.]|uniref:nucleotidyltransferase family protein n=1 Tax=uncultured Brevundimonas sp. TaxID=213418 RepID=UPI00262EECEA|nr:nucleotidyltransferase family protein [uncultured Brevundimonas sp.]
MAGPQMTEAEREARLVEILRDNDTLMQVLRTVRDIGLPDWRLFSGSVYQSVWNAQTGRPAGFGTKDYDIGYFDPDTSWDAEDVWIKRVAAAFDEPLKSQVEVRNQARVHLWAPQKFGEDFAPLLCTDDAPARFVAPAFAVGVRLEADDSISVHSAYGLADVFDMVIRPTPRRGKAKGWDKIIAKLKDRWPELTVAD